MRQIEAIVATSHIDLHNERLSVEVLRSIVDAVARDYLPVGYEHDPRNAPLGRVKSAHLRERSDGAYEVVATFELFDRLDSSVTPELGRELRLKTIPTDCVLVSYDRNYRNAEDQAILDTFAKQTGSRLSEEVKKSLDPISILAIGAGAFAIGGIAKGFFSKLGSDGYEALKSTLKKLFEHKKLGEKEKLLMLEFEVYQQSQVFHVEVIVTNPSAQQIDHLLSKHLERVDSLVARYFDERVGLKKLVFEIEEQGVKLKFGVRKDVVPFLPKEEQ